MFSRTAVATIAALVLVAACARHPKPAAPQPAPAPVPPQTPAPVPQPPAPQAAPAAPAPALVPLPAIVEPGTGDGFTITPATVIAAPADPAVQRTAKQIAEWIRRATGLTPGAAPAAATDAAAGVIELAIAPGSSTGAEGYDLTIAPKGVTLTAATPAGLFYSAQTLRQLLPYWSEYEAIMYQRPRPTTLPPLHVRDAPRYEWRGGMLDVARHFFTVDEVKQFVDLLALNKMNRLHLHLADDCLLYTSPSPRD